MKPKILFSGALLVFFIGLGLLVTAWSGPSSVTAAWPISGSVVKLSGSATGWRAMAGLAGFVLALVLFLWGLISLITRPLRRRKQEPLPEPQPHPSSEVKN
jgi:TRAP-type C4-dicarboxylate transport system permease small subunit